MNDRDMKQLLFNMEASAGAILEGHRCMNDPDHQADPEVAALAKGCFEDGALRLARAFSDFYEEVISRRHASGNFDYPFEPLEPVDPPRR